MVLAFYLESRNPWVNKVVGCWKRQCGIVMIFWRKSTFGLQGFVRVIPLFFKLTPSFLNWVVFVQTYVTHALQVEGLRGIMTIPAKLESTTLAFAYGVDLFFTRITPSRTYDSLTEDFSYALLLITIVALVIAIFATWVLSERKELQDKWKWSTVLFTSSSNIFLDFIPWSRGTEEARLTERWSSTLPSLFLDLKETNFHSG